MLLRGNLALFFILHHWNETTSHWEENIKKIVTKLQIIMKLTIWVASINSFIWSENNKHVVINFVNVWIKSRFVNRHSFNVLLTMKWSCTIKTSSTVGGFLFFPCPSVHAYLFFDPPPPLPFNFLTPSPTSSVQYKVLDKVYHPLPQTVRPSQLPP